MNIALYTTQIPRVMFPHQEITAIIVLSQERAKELLELMNDITIRATTSSTIFRISSFEASALIVPAYALEQLPAPNDFIILPEDFSVNAITRIKLIHANVMPRYANWSAVDENNRFIFTTADLPAEVLTLAARGESLPPGSTNASLNNIPSTSDLSLITTERKWLH
jgi:hypothetical protein